MADPNSTSSSRKDAKIEFTKPLPVPTFGDMRSLVQEEPSSSGWQQLCSMLERWPDQTDLEPRILPYLEGAMRRWPAILRVAKRDWFDQMLLGLPSPEMSLVGHLKFEGRKLSMQEMHHFAHAKNISHIEILSFYGSGLEPPMLQEMLHAHMGQIHTLRFVQNPISDEGLEILSRYKDLRQLQVLQLSFAQIGDFGLERLLEASAFEQLEELILENNFLSPEGALALSVQGRMPVLRHLDLSYNRLRTAGVKILAESTVLEHVESLKLTSNAMGDQGVRALVQSVAVQGIKTLNLGYNRIRTHGIEALAQSDNLSELESLDLRGNFIDDEAAMALARSRGLGGLRELHLEESALTSRGRRGLATSPYLHEKVRSEFV